MKLIYTQDRQNAPQADDMAIRFAISPQEAGKFNTEQLRQHFLVGSLMQNNTVQLVYTHYDRVLIGGVKPVNSSISLPNHPELKADFFLQRRELGIINTGGSGTVTAGRETFPLNKLDCVYIGKGTEEVSFASDQPGEPSVFYLLSAPAHTNYPNSKYTKEQASPVALGAAETANKRTVYKYIHLEGIRSCQLVMGLTVLESGSVWNSIPPHTHTRRMEVYFYFDIAEQHRVFHFMGEPQQTRHIAIANHEAVISPPWSTHFGCGTSNYGFIWGMAGENLVYNDMDPAPVIALR